MLFIINDAHAQEASAPVEGGTEVEQAVEQVEYQVSAEKMMMDNLMMLGLLFFIFYFLLIRPQQRKVKAHRELTKGLAKGDKVITGGGIIGTVSKFEGDDIVVVEIAPEVKVRIARSYISDKVDDSKSGKNANDN
jgi:preprotein translocase subunit YajC